VDIAYDAWVELHEWELWGWRLLDSLPAVSSKELASNGGEPVQGVVKHLDDNTMLLAPVGLLRRVAGDGRSSSDLQTTVTFAPNGCVTGSI